MALLEEEILENVRIDFLNFVKATDMIPEEEEE